MSFILCGQCGQQNSVTANHCCNCDANLPGISSDRPDPFVPGTYLDNGHYLIEKLLASGKIGRTYQGEDTSGEYQAIALREFTPPTPNSAILGAILEKIVQLLTSAIIQRPHIDHPQLAKFWQVFTEDNRIFLVGDLLPGKSYKFLLQQRKRSGKCFSEAEIIQLWRNILPILSYLHNKGVIHRYITPENILNLGGDRPVVLNDCGGIQELAIKLMSPNNFIASLQGNWGNIPRGKPGYAPEEQLRQGIVTPSSDLYALAVTSVVLITGKPPAKLIDVFTMSWTWHREVDLTPVVKNCLIKMLDTQPGDRFQSAAELLELIESNPDIPLPIIDPEEQITYSPELADQNLGITDRPMTDRPFSASQSISREKPHESSTNIPQLDQSSIVVPKEIRGWNWGAAILPGIWCISNHVWVGLFAWVGFLINPASGLFNWLLVGLILGLQGNQLAWKSRNWKSLDQFKVHQRRWGIFIGIIGFMLLSCFGLLILIGLSI